MFYTFLHMSLRLFIGFVSLLIYINVLGEMQISPMTPVNQIGNFVLGGIIGGIIYDLELHIGMFFMAITIWGGLMVFVNYLNTKNLKTKRMIEGKPVVLMEEGQLDVEAIKEVGISADDLMSNLHQKGVASLDELRTIWLESSKQITIVKKDDERIAFVIIEDGQINDIDLLRSGKTEDWLYRELENKYGLTVEDVFIGEIVRNELHIYPYTKRET